MFYHNDQPCTPSFPIELVKTESDFIIEFESAEIDLERWMLLVAIISVEAYHFLGFSDLAYHPEDMGIGVFWLYWTTDRKETKLGSCD